MHTSMRTAAILTVTLLLLAGCSGGDTAQHSAKRILFFGDSITELGAKPGGYVSLVRDSLAVLHAGCEVIGAGISGNKITDLLARVERDVLPQHPSIVVVYIGINDVWHFEFAARGLTGTPKDRFDAGLQELITTLRGAGAQVILCTPSVIGERNNGTNKYDAMLEEYSAISRAVAARNGIALCDLRQAFVAHLAANNPEDADRGILTTDGVHLNAAGNRFVAAQMVSMLDGSALLFPQR